MKPIKVADNVHRDIRILSAESGRTAGDTASILLREAMRQVRAKRLDLGRAEERQQKKPETGKA